MTTRKNEIENESNVILMVHGRAYVKGDNIFAWLLKYVNMGYEKVVFNSRQNSTYLPPVFMSNMSISTKNEGRYAGFVNVFIFHYTYFLS